MVFKRDVRSRLKRLLFSPNVLHGLQRTDDALHRLVPVVCGTRSTTTLIGKSILNQTTAYISAGVGAALAASALLVRHRTSKTERDHPPTGRVLHVDGVRIHYIDRGDGEPLVLLHGNGTMIDDMTLSGLVDLAAKRYRVIVFDRPGFGHSTRPNHVTWTPQAQARLFHHALRLDGLVTKVDEACVSRVIR
jgi:hypothetical protein